VEWNKREEEWVIEEGYERHLPPAHRENKPIDFEVRPIEGNGIEDIDE